MQNVRPALCPKRVNPHNRYYKSVNQRRVNGGDAATHNLGFNGKATRLMALLVSHTMFASLLAATSWVDVSIPGIAGLLMLICPQKVFKSTGCEEKDLARQALGRKGGAILLVVAGMYYCTSTFGR
jgi:hypothetical protein